MKHYSVPKVRIITASNPQVFEEQINEFLEGLSEIGAAYELHYNMTQGYCVYINYQEKRQRAETVEDEYKLRGITYHCYDCPKYRPPMDGRVKYSWCEMENLRVGAHNNACETFYKALKEGKVVPNERIFE